MTRWYEQHRLHPYPSDEKKIEFAEKGGKYTYRWQCVKTSHKQF